MSSEGAICALRQSPRSHPMPSPPGRPKPAASPAQSERRVLGQSGVKERRGGRGSVSRLYCLSVRSTSRTRSHDRLRPEWECCAALLSSGFRSPGGHEWLTKPAPRHAPHPSATGLSDKARGMPSPLPTRPTTITSMCRASRPAHVRPRPGPSAGACALARLSVRMHSKLVKLIHEGRRDHS